jgi:AbrB family looped-hinge helix DNA binding protein
LLSWITTRGLTFFLKGRITINYPKILILVNSIVFSMSEVVVTRNGQITLTKDIREKLSIKEGDVVILNTMDNLVIITKRDPKVFEKSLDFLPDNFEKVLSKIRKDADKRFKQLGITE